MKSVGLLVVLALVAAASADPFKFDRDIKINVYGALKSLYAAAPLSAFKQQIAKTGHFQFSLYPFKFYPEEKMNDFVIAYKPKGESSLHGYFFKAEDVSKYDDSFFNAVRPIYEYLNSGEYYAFTPIAAKQAAPQYFNAPLKKIFYEYYKDADVNHDIPVVILVPKSEVDQAAIKDFILIAEYEVSKDANHVIHEHFDASGKTIERRDAFYAAPTPYYRYGSPYEYAPAYYYDSYPYSYSYYGYPEYMRTGLAWV